MSDIIEKLIIDDDGGSHYLPIASYSNAGIASFSNLDFVVTPNGLVRTKLTEEDFEQGISMLQDQLDGKVSIIPPPIVNNNMAYVTHYSRGIHLVDIGYGSEAGRLAEYVAGGKIFVSDASDGGHATPLRQVDGRIQSSAALKQDKRPNSTDLLIDGNYKVNSKYLPDALLGALQFQSTWSPATNSPLLDEPAPKGFFWICSDSGSRFDLEFTTGDWLLSLGDSWTKVDNTDAVASVNGMTGTVVVQIGDIPGLNAEFEQVTYNDRVLAEDGETLLLEDGEQALLFDILQVLAGLDRLGTVQSELDLTNIADAVFGTIPAPIEINAATAITFNKYYGMPNYQRSFLMYVRRNSDVEVEWPQVIWSRGEKPLLPVGFVQRIMMVTFDGVTYYGTGGTLF